MFKITSIIIVSLVLILSGISYSQEITTAAVLTLKAKGISNDEADVLTDRLRSDFVNLKKYSVVERENMEEIMREQGLQLSGCISDECAVEAGKILGVKKMLSGSVGKFGEVYFIELRIIDVESAKIESSSTYEYRGEKEILLTDGVNNALRKLLGYELIDINNSKTTTNKTTTINDKIENRINQNPQELTNPQNQTNISSGNQNIEQIPGVVWDPVTSAYYLTPEDVDKKYPLNVSEAKKCAVYPDVRKNLVNSLRYGNQNIEQIPGAVWDPITREYYLVEDVNKKFPINANEAKLYYRNQKSRKEFIQIFIE